MLANQRREKILEVIKEEGAAKVVDLARVLEVTEVTIRQDLDKLEKEGLIIKEHGGAFLKSVEDLEGPTVLTHPVNQDKKRLIAQKCLDFIDDGDILILDSGSTTTEIAKQLSGNNRTLTIITNALNIALLLGAESGIEVVLSGGELSYPALSLTGQKAADIFKGLHAQKLFLGTAGLSLKAGLTYPHISDLVVKKAMIKSAETIYVVTDSTKIGTSAFASLGGLGKIDYLVTDGGIKDKHKKGLLANPLEVIIAE